MQRRVITICSLLVWNLLLWILPAQISAQAQNGEQARIERGRQVVAQVCVTCHTTLVRMLQVHKQTREQWKDTVYFMISRGAQIMPDEIESVTAYLTANAGSDRQVAGQSSGGGRPGTGGSAQQLPEAEGMAILQRTCRQCHELATASTKLSSEDWNAVIARMLAYGAKLTPADQQKLISYLNGLAK